MRGFIYTGGLNVNAGLELDTDDARDRLNKAISHYTEAVDRLSKRRPSVDSACLGEGFTGDAERLGAALSAVHDNTLAHLQARVKHYEDILALTDDVESADDDNAADITAVLRSSDRG
nr:Uncharacterised protein [Streptococcus thermophilus]